uniref:Uncharacterized protein C823.02 n=1 Tax=Schizosaccharomyces pombe (strain 972 / ATCC 24843) TaxID=284812 RepID=YKB2_SCHPO|nr:uncharacterized protein SPAC823.02 [Schizosaccharomyces pombe]O13886.3 RecName: Full=Uncharacterized protein C823.02 [Schizosaccharomyces pombe 972h-]CAB11249.3 hypothetical protein [Schizosaccharomyces pombe]CAB90147.1 sequence orphan [Schizosaccharomyces pombe]|eukprot:NP_593829.1 uncharacterized protein SPAC823.02 [Schizosaccharomyces pombe]
MLNYVTSRYLATFLQPLSQKWIAFLLKKIFSKRSSIRKTLPFS